MAHKIYNFKTVDTDEGISAWCNKSSRPLVVAALIQAESGRHKFAWRDKSADGLPNDVSGGLLQVSIQFMSEINPLGYNPDEDMNSYHNHEAWKNWSWDIPSQMEYGLPLIERNISWAVQGLGKADDPQVELLACLLWNAPNLGILRNHDGSPMYKVSDPRQRKAVAKYWLNPDLGDHDTQHAQNFLNYQGALNWVKSEGFVHEVQEGSGTVITMPDLTDYTEPNLPGVPDYQRFKPGADKDRAYEGMTNLVIAVEDLQARFLVLDKQQHIQTDALGVASNPAYGPEHWRARLANIVSMLRGGGG